MRLTFIAVKSDVFALIGSILFAGLFGPYALS